MRIGIDIDDTMNKNAEEVGGFLTVVRGQRGKQLLVFLKLRSIIDQFIQLHFQ